MKVGDTISYSVYSLWRDATSTAQRANRYVCYCLGLEKRSYAVVAGIELHKALAGEKAELPPDIAYELEASKEQVAQALGGPAVAVEYTAKSPNFGMHGRIDAIHATQDGIVIVDYKTGKPNWRHRRQLVWYLGALAEDETFASTERLGALAYLDRDRGSLVELNRYELQLEEAEKLSQDARAVISEIRATEEPLYVVLPVRGTQHAYDANPELFDIPLQEGDRLALEIEEVVLDGHSIAGIRFHSPRGPVGWLPDELKHRISLQMISDVPVVSYYPPKEGRSPGIRVGVPLAALDVEWR